MPDRHHRFHSGLTSSCGLKIIVVEVRPFWYLFVSYLLAYDFVIRKELVILFSIHYSYRPQLFTPLLVLPFLLVALIANQHRTDYIGLLFGLAVVWVPVFVVRPSARKALLVFAIICNYSGRGLQKLLK